MPKSVTIRIDSDESSMHGCEIYNGKDIARALRTLAQRIELTDYHALHELMTVRCGFMCDEHKGGNKHV